MVTDTLITSSMSAVVAPVTPFSAARWRAYSTVSEGVPSVRAVTLIWNGVFNFLLGKAHVRAKLHEHAGEIGAECVDYPLRRARRLTCKGHPCLGVSCDCRPGEVLRK